ncbi:hypothetical protein IW261DRAFT_1425694 [Armillaria novae-zelandiae]|uniref:Uncharacterized protein n=1 Tax=Armillaria novae-zelandiae TaxID=153914 RepID=A0AA39NS53_9AGAR|nr:hypothetical protein IW261DRAFT_1425694 [Armillaria novae-zelandiae]
MPARTTPGSRNIPQHRGLCNCRANAVQIHIYDHVDDVKSSSSASVGALNIGTPRVGGRARRSINIGAGVYQSVLEVGASNLSLRPTVELAGKAFTGEYEGGKIFGDDDKRLILISPFPSTVTKIYPSSRPSSISFALYDVETPPPTLMNDSTSVRLACAPEARKSSSAMEMQEGGWEDQ